VRDAQHRCVDRRDDQYAFHFRERKLTAPFEPDDRDAAAGPSRSDAADQLKRTSLAANPVAQRKKTIFVYGSLGAMALLGVGFFWMNHSTPTAAPAAEKPKIAENAPRPAPLAHSSAPAVASAATPASAPAVDPAIAEAERREAQRRRQEAEAAAKKAEAMRQARIHSDVFAGTAGSGDGDGGAADQPADDGKAGAHKGTGPNDANSSFARSVADQNDSSFKVQTDANLQCKIRPGKVLEGHMVPRIVSDLPGAIAIMLDRDVYGEEGRIPLLPWGTRITGKPNSTVRKGQERTFVATATAYLPGPDGEKIELDSTVADQLGSSGLDGDVDNHYAQILGMSAVLSILGAGSSNVGVSGMDNSNSAAMYRENVQSSLAQSSQQLLSGYANIPPTLTVAQGARVRIQVEHELDFSAHCHLPKADDDSNDGG
jgi:type IV secretion system protein VirB10